MRERFAFAHIEDVADGQALLKKALEEKWYTVITDIGMPGLNGEDALQRIKQAAPQLPMLVISLYAEEPSGC